MTRHLTSLLSLPDELLVETFEHLADPPLEGIHPLWSLTRVCRRVREVAQTVLYRDVILDPGWGAPPHFRAAVTQNPSLGVLVSSLDMHDDVDTSYYSRGGSLDRKTWAATHTLARLKEVRLSEVTTDEAASILAALPSPPLRSLDMEIFWTADPSHWRDLQIQLSRFSQLRDLCVRDIDTSSPGLAHAPRATRRSPRHLTLPQVVELHVADYILVEGLDLPGPCAKPCPTCGPSYVLVRERGRRFRHSCPFVLKPHNIGTDRQGAVGGCRGSLHSGSARPASLPRNRLRIFYRSRTARLPPESDGESGVNQI